MVDVNARRWKSLSWTCKRNVRISALKENSTLCNYMERKERNLRGKRRDKYVRKR